MGNVKILKASAGSGKTYQLAYAYIRNVIDNPGLYRNILAVTFTNKATEEMKQRIIREINRLACGHTDGYLPTLVQELELPAETIRQRALQARTRILHNYTHFTIVTIDKFFQRIIRSFIKELGIDIHFNLELQTDSLLENATDRLIEEIAVNDRLRQWVVRFAEEKIDNNGKWDVRGEIINLGRELFKEQYKTLNNHMVTSEKLADVVGSALHQSHTIKQQMHGIATDALEQMTQAGLSPEEFSYGRQGCMGYFYKIRNGEVVPYGKRVRDALESEDKWVNSKSPRRIEIRAVATLLRPLLQALCAIYDDNFRFLNTTALIRTNYRSLALLNDLSEKITEICTEQHLIPISETNAIISKLIAGNDTPFIYEKVGNAFSHFMIDEFQDTSSQQWNNFIPLLENAVSQEDGDPVLLVGDVKQSIYRWRGGDWQILGRKVQQRFHSLSEETLDTNYRSVGVIVEFNNNLIEACVRKDNDQLNQLLDTTSNASRQQLTDMLASAYKDLYQKHHQSPDAGYVSLTEYDPADEGVQQAVVIETIENLQQRGYAPGEIAILVRTNTQGVSIAKQLLDYKAQNPHTPYCYDVVTQEALLISNSNTVGFIIAVLNLATNPNDLIHRAYYNRYLKQALDASLPHTQARFLQRLRQLSLEEAFAEITLQYQLADNRGEIAYIQALEEQVHSFSTSRIADIPLFLQWWNDTGSTQSINLPRNRDAINIITIHKAKGLQFKAVLIPYCNWNMQPQTGSLLWAKSEEAPFDTLGTLPLSWSKALGDSYFSEAYYRETVLSHIDNINLFYVAATRAEEELHIMLPHGSKESTTRIGNLIAQSIVVDSEGYATIGTLTGRVSTSNNYRVYRFGTPLIPTSKPLTETDYLTEYPIGHNTKSLKFKLNSQRYFEEEASSPLTLRSYGIIMHKLFEHITDHTEIETQLQHLRNNGNISAEEAIHVQEYIQTALNQPLIASWFDRRWTSVHNEHTIMIPHDSTVRRPDRVLTKGTEAVVIDYKFGQHKQKRHATQIEAYTKLLRNMGYRTVKGYLWYVELQEVQEVFST